MDTSSNASFVALSSFRANSSPCFAVSIICLYSAASVSICLYDLNRSNRRLSPRRASISSACHRVLRLSG